MDIGMMESVVWSDASQRRQWWHHVLGIDTDEGECAGADLVVAHHDAPLGDESYPQTPHPPVAAAAA